VIRQRIGGGQVAELVVRRCHTDDIGADGSRPPAVEQVVEAVPLARDEDQQAWPIAGVVQLPGHPQLVGDGREVGAPLLHPGPAAEVDAHEEAAGIGVAELVAIDDVALTRCDGRRHAGHDPGPVGAGEGQDQLGHVCA